MAKITRVFASGTLGPLIFYEWKGKPVVRSRPGLVRQTEATINESRLFGKAKTLSRILRQGLAPLVQDEKGKPLMYRVDKAVRDWLRSGQQDPGAITGALSSLELNAEVSFRDHFRKPVSLAWAVPARPRLTIPVLELPRDVVAPPFTDKLAVLVTVAGCRLNEPVAAAGSTTTLLVPYTPGPAEAQELELHLDLSTGSLHLIAVALQYQVNRDGRPEMLKDPKWLPACIVGGFYQAVV